MGGAVLVALLALGCLTAPAAARTGPQPGTRIVRYHGFTLTVPRDWPVFDLARHPAACARFNRHAVYLGAPAGIERCPAQALGRTEAILIQVAPGRAGAARGGSRAPAAVPAVVGAGDSTSGWLVDRRAGVMITATWVGRPGLIRRALGLRSLQPLLHPAGVLPPGVAEGDQATGIRAEASRRATATPGEVFTGQGFDACSTPSSSTMARWSTAYSAIGVYIGGTNEASCARSGLSKRWVRRQSAAGWHLVPIYVGRQAPANQCGCQGIVPRLAASEGRYAARNAIAEAQALGLGAGNPLYFDMEGYTRDGTNTPAVLAFLESWTTRLHAAGYLSGVYSSGDSGIVDLVSLVGTGYIEPDDLWIARWNGQDSTLDPSVPSYFWPYHERLHQDQGDVNQTHGGVTLNIDEDYLDGATAAAGTAAGMSAAPVAQMAPLIDGAPVQGQTLTLWHGTWSGVPTTYSEQWEDCDSSGLNCTPIPGATAERYLVTASDVGHEIRVVETAGNAYGQGAAVSSNATAQVLNPVPLYWIRNARGNVYPSPGTPFYGSPFGSGYRGSSITGAAGTLDGKGYWLVDSAGTVFSFGDATREPALRTAGRIRGIVAAPGGGYWLYTARGRVYPSAGTKWYGSPRGAGFHGTSITGMAATTDGQGYWLVDSAGTVFHFGDAAVLPAVAHAHRIGGIVAAPGGGYWLYSRRGNVYSSAGAKWYGSPAASHFHGSRISGLVASPDGLGYWVADSAGTVFHFGDAAAVSPPAHRQRVTGIFR